ncbi:MAG TPA: hypothetical protein PKY05_19985, partial [Fibrobacteria bacterium]|nr:hypothetical protein [Fibrobacteria bacterium]
MKVFQDAEIETGDTLLVCGKIHAPYDFQIGRRLSYRSYLRQKIIFRILSVGKNGKVIIMGRSAGITGSFSKVRRR